VTDEMAATRDELHVLTETVLRTETAVKSASVSWSFEIRSQCA
jgi:hypothetical protein